MQNAFLKRFFSSGHVPAMSAWLFVLLSAAALRGQVVISQVYGGGGNSGATYRNDYIELFNQGTTPATITGWSVQYAATTGSSWQVTNISGILQPGQYYLVSEAAGTGGSISLPAPDVNGAIPMSATAGKIALVRATAALAGSCPLGTSVADFVGYGAGTNCSLGSVTTTLSNTVAALRNSLGCANAGINGLDFGTGAPTPRNTSAPLQACSAGSGITINPTALPDGTLTVGYNASLMASGGTGPYTFSTASGTLPPGLLLSSGGAITGTPTSAAGSPFTFTVIAADSVGNQGTAQFTIAINTQTTCNPTHTITQVQGSGDRSPLVGQTVVLSGIVTGRDGNGFYIQMPAPGDNDPATSDGLYVFTTASRIPAVAIAGNSVCVTGPVGEFAPSTDPSSPTNTEINGATSVLLLSSGNAVPPPVTLAAVNTNPSGGLDQLERFEGMRVEIPELTATAPTGGSVNESNATATSNGLFAGVLPGIARPFREPGIQQPDPLPAGAPSTVSRWDANPELIAIDSRRLAAPLDVTSGSTVRGLLGPLSYSNRAYTLVLEPASAPTVTGTLQAVPVPPADPSELTVSAFNLERFYNATAQDPGTSHPVLTATAFANRLNKASLAIRTVLLTPDILAVEEMQNLDTLTALANKINSDAVNAGGLNPKYTPYLSLGNDISGINCGFLVKSAKVTVVSVTQYGKDATYANPDGTQSLLNDRPPLVLVADALRPGSDLPLRVVVIANHLRSLLSIDDPADGARVRAKREAQAEYLANLIQNFQAQDPNVHLVSVGDYNAYQFSDGYVDVIGVVKGAPAPASQVVVPGPSLVSPSLTDLVDTSLLADANRYSYVFGGSAQVIDHMLVNPNMLARTTAFAYARNDADFPETYRNDSNRPERVSDHDIPQARFRLPLGISSKVSVGTSGFVFTRATGTWVGTITVTNTSSTTLAGPLYLTLQNLPVGLTLPGGAAPLTLSTSGLAPGISVSRTLQFYSPHHVPVSFSPTAYSTSY